MTGKSRHVPSSLKSKEMEDKITGNEPAPFAIGHPVMTLRQYYAGLAKGLPDGHEWEPSDMTDLTGIPSPEEGQSNGWAKFWIDVDAAYKVMEADALIEALNKPTT